MVDAGVVIDVFPTTRKTSILRKGAIKLKGGDVYSFSGLFSPSEQKQLKKGAILEGYLIEKTLRNSRIIK